MSKQKHIENSGEFKGLKVNDGVPQPEIINKQAVERFKDLKKKLFSPQEYSDGIIKGDRTILSKAITLVESSLPAHRELAAKIVENCLPYSGKSVRIGITGVPGVGKSTFIEALGKQLTSVGNKVAVLAVDPSSEKTQGSILGDKTRMENLSADYNAFIRPSPSAGSLGGVARKTRETVILCEAAGYNIVFIETVGVGQSETAVHSMVDFFLLLMLAGAGDELQGIKRGIMEMADGIVITKADADNILHAENARNQYQNALHLFPVSESEWIPGATICSALKNTGISEVWNMISNYVDFVKTNGYFDKRRKSQARYWMYESIYDTLKSDFFNKPEIKDSLENYENKVQNGEMSSFVAASELINKFLLSQK
ncbi:MAG: ATPase/protein kinase [Bacteroidetes bacterium GWF2_38_335]|nr:MAG: ATPase/protein kinase [Bacteroidetes bacterium GWF2_38_335]OFY80127.1 MAG: ATPase/protein kinase [Bacteroidetes bacterium RIFOXYA12_FULL_38_20]HBS88546.1 methylmalonyl Co-A mutase-associated GTPase MeaB [Bacteroidales bacterium]